MAGVDDDCSAVFLVGWHAKARGAGVLAHTINSFAFSRVSVNGAEVGEAQLYGAVAAEFSVPIALLTGDDRFVEETASIEKGDAILLYTDGLTEARDEARGFYGEAPLLAVLGDACGKSAEAIKDSLVADVQAFRGEAEAFDDLTLLVVERRP